MTDLLNSIRSNPLVAELKNFLVKEKDAAFESLQTFGRALLLPIAVLPAMGLFLGIGGALSNPNTLAAFPFLNVYWLQYILQIMADSGNVVFANLPILFAVGLAVGLARTDRGTVGLAAVLSILIMNATIHVALKITGKLAEDNLAAVGQSMCLGIQSLDTGVFGGMIVGVMTWHLHRKFYKTKLPQVLEFFGGSRFVPIVCAFASICLGVEVYVIWPHFQELIFLSPETFDANSYLDTLKYGFFLRMLGPFGLHHIFYLPFWTTMLGGVEVVNGQLVEGTQKIFFAQLADPNTIKYYEGISRFMSGRFITMMFGLVGAAYAIYKTALPQNKKFVGGMMISSALTSFLTGITEPLEFSFLFAAPPLYVLHAFFDGCAFMLAHMLQITIGQTFSGGLIDFIMFGVAQGVDKTNWPFVLLVGIPWSALYYFSFKFLIEKYNFQTLGRGEKIQFDTGNTLSDTEQTRLILSGLGGRDNIVEPTCCTTRLRVTVKNPDLVDDKLLTDGGAKVVIQRGVNVQIVFDEQVTDIKDRLEKILT